MRGEAPFLFSTLALLVIGALAVMHIQLPSVNGASTQAHGPIVILGNHQFTFANGVVGGNGTSSDPYVIEAWSIDSTPSTGIRVAGTTAHFVIRDVRVKATYPNNVGIAVENVVNGRIENVTVVRNAKGIWINSSNNTIIRNSTLSSNLEAGLLVTSSRTLTVSASVFAFHRRIGIELSNSGDATVDNNSFSGPGFAVAAWFCNNIRFSHNYFTQNSVAIQSDNSSNLTIFENKMTANTPNGIVLQVSSNVTITGNTFLRNSWTGVHVSASTQVRVYHNNFVFNSKQSEDSDGRVNRWDDGYPSGGNYWTDYIGLDACNELSQDNCNGPDGIGDIPYTFPIGAQDRYPLMRPFGPEDNTPPHWPDEAKVEVHEIHPTRLTLAWTPSEDNNWIRRYGIYEGSSLVRVTPDADYFEEIGGLSPSTTYTFKIEAGDSWDNWSYGGPSITLTTPVSDSPENQTALLQYRLSTLNNARAGSDVIVKHEFANIGRVRVKVTDVTVRLGFNISQRSLSNVPIELGAGENRTVTMSLAIPGVLNLGEYNMTGIVYWAFLETVSSGWIDVSDPIVVRGHVLIGTSPSGLAEQGMRTLVAYGTLLMGPYGVLVIGAYVIAVILSAYLVVQRDKKKRELLRQR